MLKTYPGGKPSNTMFKKITLPFIKVFLPFIASVALAQIEKAPNRAEGEYANRTIIRGVTLINSTGAPPVVPLIL